LDLAQRILHADTAIDAYILAHGAIKTGAEAVLYGLYGAAVENEAIAAVLRHIAEDKKRHAAFGWEFVADRHRDWDDEGRAAAKAEIARFTDELLLGGYLTPFLAPLGIADDEREAETRAAAAGLGSADEAAQRQALAGFLAEVRDRLGGMSIDVPEFPVL
jgi:hypothetical protein